MGSGICERKKELVNNVVIESINNGHKKKAYNVGV